MQSTICLSIRNIDQQQAEVLMALLSEKEFEAFEETENGLEAYISEEKFDESAAKAIISDYTLDISIHVHAPRNWNAEWEQQYRPVVVEDIIGIRASFHPPLENVQTEIIITPKMSFGTGHHATTWQMLKMMSELDFGGWNVFVPINRTMQESELRELKSMKRSPGELTIKESTQVIGKSMTSAPKARFRAGHARPQGTRAR